MSNAAIRVNSILRLLLLVSLISGLAACNRQGQQQTSAVPSRMTEDTPQIDSGQVLGVLPEFSLTDQNGEEVGSYELTGKLWIANFIFTRCAATCPEQTARMAELQEILSQDVAAWKDIRLVSFSVDPEFDSSEVLRAYADKAGADHEHWAFLTGSRERIWELCQDGFKLPVAEEADANMPITHSPMFVLVDPYLRIRGYYDVLNGRQVSELEAAVQSVSNEQFLFPPDTTESTWLEGRASQQVASMGDVYHEFTFQHRTEESGIRFRHYIVDDSGKNWKPCHYDHGNGIASADVDGDGLADLYFTSQVGPNELWRNLGDGTFENITAEAGVAMEDRIGVSASFADIDNDGDADLYATSVRGGNLLFENDGLGHFKDISTEAGVNYSGHSSGAVFFDFDRDGLLDLFLANVGQYTMDRTAVAEPRLGVPRGESGKEYEYYIAFVDAFSGHLKQERAEQSILYRNLGENRFQDVSAEVGLQDVGWSGDATPIDLNGDGWLDLYVLNMQGHDECYVNVEGQRFEKQSRQLFPSTPWGSMGVKAFDFDNDGDQDLFLTDMHSDMSEDLTPNMRAERAKSNMQWPETLTLSGGMSIWGNAFFRNDGGGEFVEVSDQIGAENYWPWGLSVGDLNADGYEDAFIASSMNFPYRYGVNSVLLNDHGQAFFESAFPLGVEPRRDRQTAVPWFDVDLDGADRNHRIKASLTEAGRPAEGRVVVWSAAGSRSSLIFDIENDGDLDIVTNEFNDRPLVLVSDLTDRKPDLRYVKLRLVGATSNRDGLGAVVTVRCGPASYTQFHDGQSGYLSQSQYPLYFGLGDATTVDAIEVRWPSGINQTITGPLDMNTTIEVREPQGEEG